MCWSAIPRPVTHTLHRGDPFHYEFQKTGYLSTDRNFGTFLPSAGKVCLNEYEFVSLTHAQAAV